MNNIVEFKSVRKTFRDTTAIRELSFTIDAGDRIGVIGDNGAGKSTLFNLLVGTARPSCGSVRVFGLDPNTQAKAVRSRIGYVSAIHPFHKWMRVSELLNFLRPFYSSWNREFEEELLKALAINLKKRIGEHSTGMLARVAILVAFCPEPDLLIFDEPFTGLDATNRFEIQMLTKRYLEQNSKRTLLLATHHADELRNLVDRVLILSEGSLVYSKQISQIGQTIKKVHLKAIKEPSFDSISVIGSRRSKSGWILHVNNWDEDLEQRLEQLCEGQIVSVTPVNLEDCLLFRAKKDE